MSLKARLQLRGSGRPLLTVFLLVSLGWVASGQSLQGPLGDYGDAPDDLFANYAETNPFATATFPSTFADINQLSYVLHRFPEERVFLGPQVTLEDNARLVDQDLDDGWAPRSFLTCAPSQLEVLVTVPADAVAGPIYLNLLFDWNHDGHWRGADDCPADTQLPPPANGRGALPLAVGTLAPEWAVQNLRLDQGPYNLQPGDSRFVQLPSILTGSLPGELWSRFTVTTEPVDERAFSPVAFGGAGWDGSGDFLFGETEDYFACLLVSSDVFMTDCPQSLADSPPTDTPPTPEDTAPLADLSLTKSVNATTPNVGEAITFTVTVTNAGPDPASGVTVSDVLPAGLAFLSASASKGTYGPGSALWSIGNLTVGETASLQLAAQVTQSGTLTNAAQVLSADQFDPDSTPGNGDPAEDDQDSATVVVALTADLSLTKTVDHPTPAVGENVTFTLTLSNAGPDTATGVAVSDPLPAGMSLVSASASQGSYAGSVWTVGSLGVGQSAFLQLTVQVTAGSGSVNTAQVITADLTDPDSTPGNDNPTEDDQDSVSLNIVSDLSVTKADSADPVSAGEPFSYAITVTNNGPAEATNVIVADALPAGVTFVSASGTGWSCSEAGGTVTCTRPSLAVGTAPVITVSVLAPAAGGTITNSVTVDSDNSDPDDSNNGDDEDTDITPAADLAITKSDSADPVQEGQPFSYTLAVSNAGPSTATNVTVSDPLPAGVSFVSASGVGWSCSEAGNTLTCTRASLPVGSAPEITVNVVAPAQVGTLTNAASVNGTEDDPDDSNNGDDEDTNVSDLLPLISVAKTPDKASVPETGGQVTFTLEVSNNGVESLTLNALSDDVFGDLNGQGTCVLPQTIPAGGTYSCAFSQTLSGNAGDTHTDTVSAQATDDDGNTASDQDSAQVSFTDVAVDISVNKTAEPGSLSEPGGNVTFTVAVTNDGAEAATLNSLSDDVFGDLNGQGTCVLPQTLTANGGTYSCAFSQTLSGDAGTTHTDTVTAVAQDNDGNSDSEQDSAQVDFTDALPDIAVTKTPDKASVVESGEDVTFTVEVSNNGPEGITLTSLSDSDFGNLNGQGTCVLPQTIPAGDSYSCAFSKTISGDASGPDHENTVSAVAQDNEGNQDAAQDTATVSFTDVLPQISVEKTPDKNSVPETGGQVVFTVVVTNDSGEILTLNRLNDDVFGSLDGLGTCSVPQTLAIGGSYTCAFSQTLLGNAGETHTDTVTATASDNENNSAQAQDNAQVDFTDVALDITVNKTAEPVSVPETGGDVTFTVAVTNNSAEAATLNSLSDNVFGNLNGQGTCSVPHTLTANGGTYSCAFSQTISGDAGTTHTDTVTAVAQDNDGNSDSEQDSAQVDFTDALPEIAVEKSVSPGSVSEPGGDVTFTVTVSNTGDEAITLTALSDDVFGDLDGQGTCAVPQTILAGASYGCQFSREIVGNAGETHLDTVTATVTDNEGNSVQDSDDAQVQITDAGAAQITVTKVPSPSSVSETGGSVTFTVTVTNDSTVDSVQITSISDDQFGNLNTICGVPFDLAPGASQQCQFTEEISGQPSTPHENTVTVSGTDDDGATVSGQDSAQVSFTDVLPDITVTKTADDTSPAPGATVTYTVTVQNNTAEAVDITSLSDDVVTGASVSDCSATTVPANGSVSCTYTGTAPADDATSLTNTVTVTVQDNDGNTDAASDSETVTTTDILPDISVTKDNDANQDSSFSDAEQAPEPSVGVTFQVTITNHTSESLTIDALSDDLHAINGTCATLVGQTLVGSATVSCTFEGQASASYGASETDTVSATVSDDDGNALTRTDTSTVTTPVLQTDLSLEKTGDSSVEADGTYTYTITVTNHGPSVAPAGDVVVSDPLPSGVVIQLVAATNWSCDSQTNVTNLSCTLLIELPSGETSQITLLAKAPDEGGPVTNESCVASNQDADPDSENNCDTHTTQVEPKADLAIEKGADKAEVAPGDSLSYTVVVTNNGPSSVTGAQVDDTFPAQFTGAGWSCSVTGGSCGASSGSGDIHTTVSLNSGGTATFTVTGTVSGVFGGDDSCDEEDDSHDGHDDGECQETFTNTATVEPPAGVTDPNSSNNSDSASTTAKDQTSEKVADLSISKTDGQETMKVGEGIAYTITVTNHGPSGVTGAQVSDTVPAEVTDVSWSCSGSCTPSGGNGNAIQVLVDLASGASVTITVQGTVSQPIATVDARLINTVTVQPPAGTTDPNPGNNSATDETVVWDRSSFVVVDSGFTCEPKQVFADVQNSGDNASAGPSTWELWFSASGDPFSGQLVDSGSVPVIAENNSQTVQVVSNALATFGDGKYAFKVFHRPGHPGNPFIQVPITVDCGDDE